MQTRPRAFTLIELMVVMGIIALLVSLLIPAIGAARAAASRSKANAELKALEGALRAYAAEYSKFPRYSTSYDEKKAGGIQVSANEVRMLLGENINKMNPRKIPFMEFSGSTSSGFLDPWGNAYRYMCDYDYDNTLAIRFADGATTNLEGRAVATWSAGPDGLDSARQNRVDDIVSWQ